MRIRQRLRCDGRGGRSAFPLPAAPLSVEFKTALAGLAGGFGLFATSPQHNGANEHGRFLTIMQADATRLSRLVTPFMKLAQATMSEARPAAQTILPAVRSRLADAWASDRLPLIWQFRRTCPAPVEKTAMEAIATTLIENEQQADARPCHVGTSPMRASSRQLCR